MGDDALCCFWFWSGAAALSYLQALSSFKTAHLNGDTYTVRAALSDLPKALVTLIFTVVTHGPNNQTGASFTPPQVNEQAKVIGRVVVDDGRVTSETFTAHEAHPSRGRSSRAPTGTITYSRFDSSPAIAAPTTADLNEPASPCDPTADGSCQVTSTGAAPHSALCKAVRAHGHDASAEEAIVQAQAAPQLREWSKLRSTELALFALEGSFAQAIEQSRPSTPRNIQAAARTR